METIKRLVLGLIPNQKCNLKCEYCYISQVEAWDEPTPLKYPPEHIAKCLSKERLGGTSLINLTGNGETLLQPDIVPIVAALLQEGHFVEIVTNGTHAKRITELLALPEEDIRRLFFKMSFHYKELKRLGLMERYFDNIKAIHEAGASFTMELMAYDGIENDIEDIKKVCMDHVGAVCHATIGRNDKRKDKGLLSEHSKEEYHEIWKALESPMLDFKLEMIDVKRKEFCYAGDWSLFVNMYTGESQPCYWQPYNQNIFEDPDKPINFCAVGHHCTQPYCTNSHAHMCWGIIPDVKTPTYADMRNRVMESGEEFLNEECKAFFSSKLYESNEQYSIVEKRNNDFLYPVRMVKWLWRDKENNVRRIKNYLKRKG